MTTGVGILSSLIIQRGTLFLQSLNFFCRKRAFKGWWSDPSLSHFRPIIAASKLCLTGTSNHRDYWVCQNCYIQLMSFMCILFVNFFQIVDGQLSFAKITKHNVFSAYHMMGQHKNMFSFFLLCCFLLRSIQKNK